MHRFACWHSKKNFRGLWPRTPMLRRGYCAPLQTQPHRHSGAACLPRLARASIVPQCLLVVDAAGVLCIVSCFMITCRFVRQTGTTASKKSVHKCCRTCVGRDVKSNTSGRQQLVWGSQCSWWSFRNISHQLRRNSCRTSVTHEYSDVFTCRQSSTRFALSIIHCY